MVSKVYLVLCINALIEYKFLHIISLPQKVTPDIIYTLVLYFSQFPSYIVAGILFTPLMISIAVLSSLLRKGDSRELSQFSRYILVGIYLHHSRFS